MPHTKFGKDWTFLKESMGVLPCELRRTDRETDGRTDGHYYSLSCAAEATQLKMNIQ